MLKHTGQIHYYPLQVTVTFAPEATQDSKVMFLCYGTDAKGFEAKTPFSGGTLIVPVPEFLFVPLSFIVCAGAYGIYLKKK